MLIDENGMIEKVWENVSPQSHIDKIIVFIENRREGM